MKKGLTKKLSLFRLLYPVAALILTALIVWLFIFTVRYLLKQIDTALTIPNPAEESTVDEARFALIAKKLNVKINTAQTNTPSTSTTPEKTKSEPEVLPEEEVMPEEGTTTAQTNNPKTTKEDGELATSTKVASSATTPPTTTTTFDNSSLKIAIYNTSGKTGAAGSLKTALEKTGFVVGTVGNKTVSVPVSLLRVKASSADYVPALKESLAKAGFIPTDEALPDTDAFDVIIMIGLDVLTQ